MTHRDGTPVGLHRFAVALACCTFLLLVAGGLVTSTDSGLSVPDWPTTYGHFMFAYPLDQMVGGIFYEHTHRMIASIVGLLTVVLALWMRRSEERKWVRALSYAALGAVILQGVLGGLTVLFLLPTPVSVGHATLGQTFFALVACIALVTSRWWRSADQPLLPEGKGLPAVRLATFSAAAVFLQLILGALMRHMHAGLAIPDFPLAYGQLVPSLAPEAIDRYTQELIRSDIRIAADGPVTQAQIIVHLLHRFWGVVTALVLAWTAVRLMRISPRSPRLATLGMLLLALVILQITLGALTVLSLKAVDITTAHVATGALLLAASVLTAFHAAKLAGGFRLHAGLGRHPGAALSYSRGEAAA